MGTRVYVGGISFEARERDLERFFKGYGRIREVLLKRGFAFVELGDPRDADDAVHDLNGRTLLGRRLIVEIAKGRPNRYGGERFRRHSRSRSYGHRGRSRSRSAGRRGRSRSRSAGRRGRSRSRSKQQRSRSPTEGRSRSASVDDVKRSRSPIKRSRSVTPERRSNSPKKSCSRSPSDVQNGNGHHRSRSPGKRDSCSVSRSPMGSRGGSASPA